MSPGAASLVDHEVSPFWEDNKAQTSYTRSDSGEKSRYQHWHGLLPGPEAFFVSFQNNALRTTGEVALKTIILFQIGIGTLANVTLFFHNVSPIWLGHRLRPTHVILIHMAVANSLALLATGIPHMVVAFLPGKPLPHLVCKLVRPTFLVAHSTTLCSTCVQSTYRFFTVTPRTRERLIFRGRAPKTVTASCCACWMFGVLKNLYVPMQTTGPQDTLNDTDTQGNRLCQFSDQRSGIVFLRSVPDAMFIGLMVWTSGSMVHLLQRHRLRLQHVHTTSHCDRCPPETRATHTVLMLVVTFVVFYMLNSIFTLCITAVADARVWLMRTTDVLISCFPTVCPFVLILRDPRTPRFCS